MDKKIISNLKEAINDGISPGCALVVLRKGKEKINFSYGYFSDKDKTKVTSDTLFDLASITKLYTAAVILQLQEMDEINIYDKVAVYLPVFSKSELRIVDLLTHRANFGLKLSEYRNDFKEKFETAVFNVSPPVKATSEVHYENITYIFLGRIIEIICQRPLKEVFSDFFDKFGLKNTGLGLKNKKKFISPPTEIRKGRVIQNSTHDESADLMGGIAGSAGIFSSASDLAIFGNLWLEGRIIAGNNLNKVFADYSKKGNRSQGLGWHQDLYGHSTKNRKIYLHPGYTGCLLAVHVSSNTVCAFTCNRTYYGRDNIKHREIMKQLVDFIF